jgi:hypothetical protein
MGLPSITGDGQVPTRGPVVASVPSVQNISARTRICDPRLSARTRRVTEIDVAKRVVDDRKKSVKATSMIRRIATSLSMAVFMYSAAHASELDVGITTLQKLLTQQLFTRDGRWYLQDDGPCYAYLEYPKTRLAGGRVLLDADLSARLGTNVAGYCAGSGFSSKVTLSGQLVGKASVLTLGDIRIDHVDDAVTAAVIDLVRDAAPNALPQALSFDVLSDVRGTPLNAGGTPVSLRQFHIVDVATRPDAVIVHFDLALSTP